MFHRQLQFLAALSLVALTLISCDSKTENTGAPATQTARRLVIGMISNGGTNEYWKAIEAGANRAAQRLDVELRWRSPPNRTDRGQQLNVLNDLTSQSIDAIAIAPIDKAAIVESIRAIYQRMPVVLVDSIAATDQYNAYVAGDNRAAGRMAGARLRDLLGHDGGEIAMLRAGTSASIEATEREERFKDEISMNPRVVIVAQPVVGDDDPAKAEKAADEIIQRYPNLAGFYAPTEALTLGILRALEGNIRAGDVKFIGFGANPELERALDVKSVDALIVHDGQKIGERAVQAAVDVVRGLSISKDQAVEPAMVERTNKTVMMELLHPTTMESAK